MDDLFFANPWNPLRRPYYAAATAPSPRMAARPAPRPAVRQVPTPDVEAATKPKVVSIPVHFVGSSEAKSEKKKPSTAVISEAVKVAAAVRVQRAFRGFAVRKNVNVVKSVEAEVEEMEMKVAEEVRKIRNEEKERLKVNEMLMRLLLKLDSVRGVRDYRRKVIKRVIALQERVDSMSSATEIPDSGESAGAGTLGKISSSDEASPSQKESFASEDLRRKDLEPDGNIVRTDLDAGDAVDGVTTRAQKETDVQCSSFEDDGLKEDIDPAIDLMHTDPEAEALDHQALAHENLGSIDGVTSEQAAEEEKDMQDAEAVLAPVDQRRTDREADGEGLDQEAYMEDDSHADSEEIVVSAGDQMRADPEAKEGALDRKAVPMEEEAHDRNTKAIPYKTDQIARNTDPEARQVKDEGMKEVMERVAVESERLKGLVAELCERSAQQCRLMSGLAERVVHLERVVQRMEKENNHRKKKRRAAGTPLTAADGKSRTPKKQ